VTCAYALANGTVAYGRLTGSLFNPNSLAAEVVAAMVLAAFLMLATRRLSLKIMLLGLIGLFSVVLAQTQSRSGVLALGAAAVTALVVAGPLRSRVTAMVLIAGSLALGYYVFAAPPQLRERVASIGSGTSEVSAGRTDVWQIAIRMSNDHPVAGVGLGAFPSAELRYVAGNVNLIDIRAIREHQLVVHNTYLELLAELGVVGLLVFCAALWVTVGRMIATLLHHARDGGMTLLLARAVVTATVAVLTSQIFNSGQYDKQLWLLLGMSTGAATLLGAARSRRPVLEPRSTQLAGAPSG
jgi:O-antigen ligase